MSNKALTLICLLLVTAILIGALGIYLKYDVLRPAGLFQDESIFAVPFLLLADDAAKFTLQHMAEQEIESSETEPSEPLTPATQPEQTAPIKQTQPPTEPPEPVKIDESWFDDALFIGDSRVVGLRDVARLGKAHYFCEVGMTVFKLLNCYTYDYGFGNGNLDKVLQKNTYGKIFIHLGLNECCNDQDVVVAQYQAILDFIKERQPNADIYIMSVMSVTAEKAQSHLFKLELIYGLNKRLKELAAENGLHYLDNNEWAADEDGYLREDMRADGAHLTGKGYRAWAEWIPKKVENMLNSPDGGIPPVIVRPHFKPVPILADENALCPQ